MNQMIRRLQHRAERFFGISAAFALMAAVFIICNCFKLSITSAVIAVILGLVALGYERSAKDIEDWEKL